MPVVSDKEATPCRLSKASGVSMTLFLSGRKKLDSFNELQPLISAICHFSVIRCFFIAYIHVVFQHPSKISLGGGASYGPSISLNSCRYGWEQTDPVFLHPTVSPAWVKARWGFLHILVVRTTMTGLVFLGVWFLLYRLCLAYSELIVSFFILCYCFFVWIMLGRDGMFKLLVIYVFLDYKLVFSFEL